MIKYLKNKILNFLKINHFKKEQEEIKILLGNLNNKINSINQPKDLKDIEFKVFSQFGDDGIIQYLIEKIDIPNEYKNFIEFGVENYTESNTRYLLFNNNWSGLIMDSSRKNVNEIINSNYYWKFDLEVICEFINRDNINELITKSRIDKRIGLLSIDIDGNDYWVWEKIDVIEPIIVIVEFNSNFGFEHKISIPYDKKFERNKAHYSNLYWGTSLKALKYLSKIKGYSFVCTNSSGNNAYFVKSSEYKKINLNLNKIFYESKFRESRNKKGEKNYLSNNKKIKEIMDLEVVDVETKEKKLIKTLFN
jgi:hypothetical protein